MSAARYLCLALAAWEGAAAWPCHGSESPEPKVIRVRAGYLPVIGPAPLRFRESPQVNSFLPPPPPVTNAAPAKIEAPPPPVALTVTLPPIPDADKGTNVMEATSPPPVMTAPADQPVSPSMFLQYFNNKNGAQPNTSGQSIDFTPPRPGAPGAVPSAPSAPAPPPAQPAR